MTDNIKKWQNLPRRNVEVVLSALIDRADLVRQFRVRSRGRDLNAIADEAEEIATTLEMASELLEELWEDDQL